jgi:hypothetical protein
VEEVVEPSIAIVPIQSSETPSTLADYKTLHALLEEEKALPSQGSKEWLHLRHDCVTASVAADILGQNRKVLDLMASSAREFNRIELKFSRPYATRSSILAYKLARKEPPSNAFMQMGQMEEQLIRHHLEKECFRQNPQDLLFPLKCRRHPNHPWLLASPDGILTHPLRLVELKTLQKRIPTPGSIPSRYYVQVQIQMEVYQLTSCEYIEAKVQYYPDRDQWIQSIHPHKSIALFHKGQLYTQPLYQDETEFLTEQPGVPVYYHLDHVQRVVLYRDDAFLKSILPHLFEFYRQFQHACPNTTLALNSLEGF